MKRNLRYTAIVIGALASGCVYRQLTPAGEQVRVTSNPEAVRGCNLVGPVQGGDGMNGGMAGQRAAEENANRELRNRAAEMGANVVLLTTSTTGFSGATQRGEAYSCNG
jgi:hypothetical protein